MEKYTPYTDINIPDFKIEKRDMGRLHVDDIVWLKKEEELKEEEVLEVEVEEIPNEEVNEESGFLGDTEFWGDNVHYEVENSLTRAVIVIIGLALVIYIIKIIFGKK